MGIKWNSDRLDELSRIRKDFAKADSGNAQVKRGQHRNYDARMDETIRLLNEGVSADEIRAHLDRTDPDRGYPV